MDLPLPDTVEGAVRWLLGGVFIFAFGFEGVAMLWEGKVLLSACSLVIALVLTLLLVYWAYVPTIVLALGAVVGLASIPLLFYGTIRAVRKRQVPKPMLLMAATFLIAIAVIAAVTGGALIYAARTTADRGKSLSQTDTPNLTQQLQNVTDQLQKEREAKALLARQLEAATGELRSVQHQLAIARQQPASQPSPPLTGTFTKKTIRELRALYEGRTRLQADAFMADEKGKLIDVDGTVVNVDSGMAFLQVGNAQDYVECRFAPEWNAKLSTFRKDDPMKIRGIIGPSQNGAQIYLQQCELRN